MILDKFIEGLQIFQKYFNENGYHIGAEHDQFYVYATDKPINIADLNRLYEMGWFQDDVERDEEGNPVCYDPHEGWSCFV